LKDLIAIFGLTDTVALFANEAQIFQIGVCFLQNEVGDPPIFNSFLAKVDHNLFEWQILKISVHENILGANFLKQGYGERDVLEHAS